MKLNRLLPPLRALAAFALAASFAPFPGIALAADAPTSEPPKVTLVAVQPHASEEGPKPALFIVLRNNAPDSDLRVHYGVGGTAENEIDYQPLRGTVTIPAGQFFAPIIVTPVDDDAAEPRETVVLELDIPHTTDGPPYHVAWPGRATAAIADNDAPQNHPPSVKLTLPRNGSVFKGPLDVPLLAQAFDPDGRVEKIEFFSGEVSLGVVDHEDPTVDPELIAINLQELDNLELPDDLPGFDAAGTGFLPIVNDLTIAPGTAFRFKWLNAPVGRHVLTAVATDNNGASASSEPVVVEIVEDNSQPVVNILAADPVAAEGEATNGEVDTARFVVQRTGSTELPLDVFLSFHGKAVNAVDFLETPTTLTIAAGQRSATVTIVPLDDTDAEGAESVVVKVEPPVCIDIVPPPPDCYVVGRRDRAEAHIRDNDDANENHPPAISIARPTLGSIHSAGENIAIVAQARDRDGRVVSVEFFADERSLGVVKEPIPAMDPTTGGFSILPPFHINWEDVPPGTYALSAEATDDDGARTRSRPVEIKVIEHAGPVVVNIVTVDGEAAEPTPSPDGATPSVTFNEGRMQIRIRGRRTETFALHYQISGSAENGVDYRRLPGSVLIPPDLEFVNLDVAPTDDALVEGVESVVVSLIPAAAIDIFPPPPLSYIVGESPRARVVILDNDTANENRPPRVELARPRQGERFRSGSEIALAAEAHDRDGHVTSVEFFANGHSLGSVFAPLILNGAGVQSENDAPIGVGQVFRMTWENAPEGPHRITAVARDNDDATRMSEAREIRVIPAEQQVVTVEAIDPRAREGGSVTVDGAIASDVNVAVFRISRKGDRSVELPIHFELGGAAANGVDYLELPKNVTIPAGQESVNVVVVPIDDDAVERIESVVLEIHPPVCALIHPPPPTCYLVGQPSRAVAHIYDNDEDRNQPPHGFIASPRPGSRFVAPADIEIISHAQDNDGWVTLVEFFANETKIGESVIHYIQPPAPGQRQVFALAWNAVPEGEYRLWTRATDNLGSKSESRPVEVAVRSENAHQLLHIRTADPIASESAHANGEPNIARFVISREGPTDSRILVPFEIGGTAENGADYQTLAGTARLLEGESSAVVAIVPIDDSSPEHRETVTLKLLPPSILPPDDAIVPAVVVPAPYELGREKAAAVILDNDRVAPPDDRDDMATARRVDAGVVMMTLTTPNLPGASGDAVVEASENLVDWFPVANATVVDGIIHFIDAEAAAKRALFYRVVSSNENVRQATGF